MNVARSEYMIIWRAIDEHDQLVTYIGPAL